MQHTERTPTPQKGLPRFFGLLAAALVCVVLVGSLLLVLNATRSKTPTTVGGSPPSVAGKTATAIPTSSPECRDNNNQADQALCLAHAETILNIAKTFGTHKVTFVRAYADTTQLMLIYTTTDSPTSDVISFTSLTTQQGIALSGGSSNTYENPQTHQWYYLINFDTQNVPAGTTELHIQSIVDGFSGKATPLNFTLPLHTAQKTVSVNKTVTSKGVSLTLERLVFTGSTTLISFKPSPSLNGLYVHTISVNGQPRIYNGGQIDNGGTVSSPALIIHLDALLDVPGSWTLTVNEGGYPVPRSWAFHFTVPAN